MDRYTGCIDGSCNLEAALGSTNANEHHLVQQTDIIYSGLSSSNILSQYHSPGLRCSVWVL